MKYLPVLFVFLSGCATTNHNWLIKDLNTRQCWYLVDSPIIVDNEVNWGNLKSKNVHTTEDFDLRVVYKKDFVKAAEDMHVNIEDCKNGLVKP